ncbi:ribosomal protein L9 domain protein [Dictyocaulus viviparus]|uniref:26S proteasome non-ATPase regulatory subunit 4 n=1 Tax=Dictyocaulus viviparus TaxID=29172 RepID=A0A0D8XK32_DICVI|nr:ribosomal protein L9 domain protein [Dictyocaulus viviparus]
MLGWTAASFQLSSAVGKALLSARSTWVLRRVFAPEPTPPGKMQRNPEELPNLMKLEVVENENCKPAGPLKVILLQDVEGVGYQFDVVEVDRRLARTDLLLTRKAVYASPFDLEYYAKIKEQMADELSKKIRIPYEYIRLGRDLQALVVPIRVNIVNKWTIDKSVLRTSLRLVGVDMLDDAIFFEEVISGPNFEIEAKLIRFYVVVLKQYIIPMLGRISHISVDESKQMLTPETSQFPTKDQMERYNIKPEQPFYNPLPEIDKIKWCKVCDSWLLFQKLELLLRFSSRRSWEVSSHSIMVQESTMICVDNSEWMRNGDFVPTRLQCQQDAANLILQCKLRANPENAVGLLSMANQVQVLSTMTQESGRLFMKLHQLEPQGHCNFMSAIKIAHLALKHRQNRNHKMRIVIFIGSPIENLDSLTKIAKKLKKEKVQCDVICFGEADSENSQIMGQFIDTLNGKEGSGSNLLVVPAGSVLTEALISSAICRGEDGGSAPVVGTGGGFEFGVDPEDDPDLALALRVSMEEERARQAAEAAAASANAGAEVQPSGVPETAQNVDVMDMEMGEMTEEQQLEWALRMSMQDSLPSNLAPAVQPQQERPVEETMDVTTAQVNDDHIDELINNPELLQQIIDDLPSGEQKEDKPKNEEK